MQGAKYMNKRALIVEDDVNIAELDVEVNRLAVTGRRDLQRLFHDGDELTLLKILLLRGVEFNLIVSAVRKARQLRHHELRGWYVYLGAQDAVLGRRERHAFGQVRVHLARI